MHEGGSELLCNQLLCQHDSAFFVTRDPACDDSRLVIVVPYLSSLRHDHTHGTLLGII